MAEKFVSYVATNGDTYGIPVDEDLLDLYPDLTNASAPTEYADLAALQNAVPLAVAKPSGVQLRTVRVSVAGFVGSASLPILVAADEAVVAARMAGATPFPVAAIAEGDLDLQVTGYTGESRLSN